MALGREGQTEHAPHWMRLLEEKYQRLHAKILNQAARFTHRRASTITTRLLKDCRRRRAASLADANLNPTDLCRDQEENLNQADEAETNEASTQPEDSANDRVGQVESAQSYYVRKQAATTTPGLGQRPQTQEGTRSRFFSDSTQPEFSSTTTPQSSGVVTRISSAFPRTRLSSAYPYDVSLQSPREEYDAEESFVISEGHVSRLDQALQLEIENQKQEWVDGLRDRLSRAVNPNSWNDAEHEDEEAQSEKMNIHCQTDRGDLEGMQRRRRRHLTRPVKTSVSRISHKTSKSCPASFGQQGDGTQVSYGHHVASSASSSRHNALKPLPTSLAPLTAKGIQEGRMRVFARMSLEARHAVDETLKEMKMEEDNNVINDTQNDDVNGNGKIIDNEDIEDKLDNEKHQDNASNSSLRNNVSAPTGEINGNLNVREFEQTQERPNRPHHVVDDVNSSVESVASDDGNFNDYAKQESRDVFPPNSNVTTAKSHSQSVSSRRSRLAINCLTNGVPVSRNINGGRCLPQLNENGSLNQEELPEFPFHHPPLPSIKRANLAFRENTFEITPPDFDIRFREIITCQKEDRETPPLDVRQQSIEKCQQWLVQCSPRR